MAALEESSGAAEDKIDVTGDVAVFKVLPATIDEDRVLPTEEATLAKDSAVAIDANGKRLANRPRRILESNVLSGEVISIDLRGRRAKSANRFVVFADQVRIQVIGEYGLCSVLADESDETLFMLHVDEFFVGSGLNENDCRIVGASVLRNGVDCFLHGFELATAIGSHDHFSLRGGVRGTNAET